MLQEKVEDLLNQAFVERTDLYLMDMDINAANEIKVVIDGDQGVTVADCVFVSRAVEHELDREEYDFSIEVTSAGASAPLKIPRQFIKNIGRQIELIDVNDKKETGVLVHADQESIAIEWKTREPKPVGKGKVTVQKQWSVVYNDIKQAKVILIFN